MVAHGSYTSIVKCRTFFAVGQYFCLFILRFLTERRPAEPWMGNIYVTYTFPARLHFVIRFMPLSLARYQSFVLCEGTRMALSDPFTGSCEHIVHTKKVEKSRVP